MTGDIQSFLDNIAGAAKSKSGDELLIFSIDQVLSSSKPNKAEVLRRCAVPRWFDAGVLRVLRERDDDNDRIIEQLREYSFVRDLGDGRLAYHDQVRRVLLDEWDRTRADELRSLHRRLYSYFNQRTTPPGSNRRAMPLVPESTMLSALPMSIQSDMFRREAIYHLLNADPVQGLAELRVAFEGLEDAHRLAEAELLCQVAAEAPLGPLQQRWLQYLRARTHQAALNLETAARQLESLRTLPDLDPELGAEISRSLGEVYAETGQWARATRLYRQSLDYFIRTDSPRAVADTMLLLGEAYQGIGVSTGSWHVPVNSPNVLLRMLHTLWIFLLGLPFQIISAVLGPRRRLLPLARYCARYQNWLLIRLYNTARIWYAQSREAFRHLNDAAGVLRADQRLADILLLYGHHEEARAAVEELLKRPEARDPYRRAWVERTLAECHLAAGDVGSAQVLLARALDVFRDLGDVRREASVLNLQARAAMQAGDNESGLSGYRTSLERFRALRYAAARERILHELRAWQRRPDTSPAVQTRIRELVNAEPEKRYVGRFIRSYLPLLQAVSMLALPLALLLTAVAAPTTNITSSVANLLSVQTFYDPLRVIGVLGLLTVIYMAVYAALAMVIIYWLPITRIEREQPDVIVTRPETVARYNSMGDLEIEQAWTSVRGWVALDRCIWERPLPLYSRTFLEDDKGRDLEIDGITGWYGELQTDLARRLDVSGVKVTRRDLGYRLLKSKSGVSVVLGIVLSLIFTSAENEWLPLREWLPAGIYALIALVALSGVLILVPLAYWVANRPLKLQRTLLLHDRWPVLLATIGALPIIVFLLSSGGAIDIVALNYSTLVWGIYVFTEALVAWFIPGRRELRLPIVGLTLVLALIAVAQPVYANYRWFVGYTARTQATGEASAGAMPTSSAQANAAASEAIDLGADPFGAYLIKGDSAAAEAYASSQAGDRPAAVEKWREAARYYYEAATIETTPPADRVLALYNLAIAIEKAGDPRLANAYREEYNTLCANQAQGSAICARINPQNKPQSQ